MSSIASARGSIRNEIPNSVGDLGSRRDGHPARRRKACAALNSSLGTHGFEQVAQLTALQRAMSPGSLHGEGDTVT